MKRPVITEKSLMLAQTANTFTFEVERGASKQEIKDAIESLYNVKVESVNTIFGHRSLKATGRRRINRVQSKIKKAVVTLKKGDTITLFDLSSQT
jgi:large subunit ribosomal protein L23